MNVERDPTLPALAWRGVVRGGAVTFTIGPQVHQAADGFFEGVWDGPLDHLASAATGRRFGSGVLIRDGELLIMPPCHALEQIFVLRDRVAKIDYVANSLMHCLAAAGISADDPFVERLGRRLLRRTNEQTAAGVLRYNPRSIQDRRYSLLTIFHDAFRLSGEGEIVFDQPFLGRDFRSFKDYRGFLQETTERLTANGADARRAHPLAPLAAVSQGYDSPAVAAIVAAAGGREATTLRIRLRGYDDCGTIVGDQLGFRVVEIPHPLGDRLGTLYVQLADGPFAAMALEFVATAGAGDDFVFSAMEHVVSGTTLFSGAWGDSIWNREADVPNGVPVRVKYGKSLGEFRLRVGFAHVPLPFAGGFHSASIKRLSKRPEMQPFTLGSDYDRPIARRLAEEAGVKRGTFARAKSAANANVNDRRRLWHGAVRHVLQRYSGPASGGGAG